MKGIRHPFFLPAWRRWATVAACLGWAMLELYLGNDIWAAIFAGLGAYCAVEFFLLFDPANYEDKDTHA